MDIIIHMKKYRVSPVLEVARMTKVVNAAMALIDISVRGESSTSITHSLLMNLDHEITEYRIQDKKDRVAFLEHLKKMEKRHVWN